MSTVKALISGFVGLDGVPVLVHEGEEWDTTHPLVQARPELFTEPDPDPKRPARGKPKGPDE